MIELIVAVLGAGTFLAIYNFFLKGYITTKQKDTEVKSAEIQKKVDSLKQENISIDKETTDKVKELEDEKNKTVTSTDLVDFLNDRTSGRNTNNK